MTTPTQNGTFGPPMLEKIVAAGITFAEVFVDHCARQSLIDKIANTNPLADSLQGCNRIS